MDAFDADVLIYAAAPEHELGRRVRALFPTVDDATSPAEPPVTRIGSVLLLPELLSKPHRVGADGEFDALAALIGHLELLPFDAATADLATVLAARHRLRAADAVHLATAVAAGADRFITNNPSDFTTDIDEIDIVYPADLPSA